VSWDAFSLRISPSATADAGEREVTLHLLESRLGDAIEVVREYGDLPPVEAAPGELNRVWMNLLTIKALGLHPPVMAGYIDPLRCIRRSIIARTRCSSSTTSPTSSRSSG
jgi:hypothetical protein